MKETIEVNQVTVRLVGAIAIVVTLAGGLVAVTVWLTNLSHRADASTNLSASIKSLSDAQAKLSDAQARAEGKIDVLVGMQGELARTSAELSGLKTRIESQDRKLETMDAWIQSTRDRMQEQGFRPPDYRPGGTQ